MAQLDSTIFTMEQQRMMLEQANVQVDTVDAMKMGQKAMKAAQAQINVDQVQDVMDDDPGAGALPPPRPPKPSRARWRGSFG